jgi:hypothetical protein
VSDRTIADMSLEEQIQRLVNQRNELWRLLDSFSFEFGGNAGEGGSWMRDDDYVSPEARVEVDDDGTVVVEIKSNMEGLCAVRNAAEKLWHQARAIVGNTYVVEGYNPHVDEALPQGELPKGHELYSRTTTKAW